MVVVGNRLRLGTKAVEQLESFFGGLGHPVVARLCDTQLYPAAAAAGASLFDETGKRAKDYLSEWQPLLKALEVGL